MNGLRVTAQEVVTYLTEPAGALESRIDRIIAGSPEAKVHGIGVAFIASHDAVLEAARLGVNLLVTHEGAFYSHQEEQGFAPEDPVHAAKRKLIESDDLIIYRFHDHPHSYRPDIITAGLIGALGWGDYEHRDLGTASVVRLPQSRRLSDIAEHVKQKLNLPYLRAVGDPEAVCGHIGIAVGYRGGGQHAIPLFEQDHLDLMIIGEGPEWETPEYVRDAAAQGRAKALLMLGHAASEEPGMKLISERLAGRFPGLPVHFIPTGSMIKIL
ncbi:Nif3-like dinuclear metal center hexameric protein [Paenibacillus sp. OAE614]|uniref:Nif3-like dinuclear metal center hexameric protein n=1 Tax=Paenibacillus sp. OAE614 TaxID=2663804 RepID=UPI003399F533